MHGHLNVKLRNISNLMKINPMKRGKLRGKIRKEDTYLSLGVFLTTFTVKWKQGERS